jgi:hypothetical protein
LNCGIRLEADIGLELEPGQAGSGFIREDAEAGEFTFSAGTDRGADAGGDEGAGLIWSPHGAENKRELERSQEAKAWSGPGRQKKSGNKLM